MTKAIELIDERIAEVSQQIVFSQEDRDSHERSIQKIDKAISSNEAYIVELVAARKQLAYAGRHTTPEGRNEE